ncbi:MAG: sulfatase-like hydrolase/transferase [Planctomycetes bacterium]|nr:sulfatase-like hydrolase/transferase [Planctomycetota bacterium]
MTIARLLDFVLLAALGLLAACGAPDDTPPRPVRPPNIVLVTLDTVRVDHLSTYGYPRRTSPHLTELAAVADRYTAAQSTAPWTVPSHASIFTGRYTFQHGAEASDEAPEWATQNAVGLAESFDTLAELLAARGYRTGGFVANEVFLAPRFGFGQGFQTYLPKRLPGRQLNQSAFEFLNTKSEQPFFLFVNYMDAHRPYRTAPIDDAVSRGLLPPDPTPAGELLDRYIDAVMAKTGEDVVALRERVISQYDHGVAHADLALGELVAKLKALGLFDDTVIVVTADHGEYFGEHELVEHNKDVYQEALRVPLVVKHARQTSGRVIDTPVCHAELARIVAATLTDDQERELAKSFPYAPGAQLKLAEIWLSRPNELKASWGARFKRKRAALYLERWKYIRSSDGQHELYDLENDPRETRNLIAEKPELAKTLDERLARFEAESQAASQAKPVDVTDEELETLRQLGYADGK